MGYCANSGGWHHTGPQVSAFYEVRPCPTAWGFGPDCPFEAPPPRIAYVDVSTGRFDASVFGGDIKNPVWEWRGPIAIPDSLPNEL